MTRTTTCENCGDGTCDGMTPCPCRSPEPCTRNLMLCRACLRQVKLNTSKVKGR